MDINRIINKMNEIEFEILPFSTLKKFNQIKAMLTEYNDNLPEIKSFSKNYESNNQNCLFEVKGRNNLHGGIIKVFGVMFDINNTMTHYPITKLSEQNSYFLVWNYENKHFEFLPCEDFEPIHENVEDKNKLNDSLMFKNCQSDEYKTLTIAYLKYKNTNDQINFKKYFNKTFENLEFRISMNEIVVLGNHDNELLYLNLSIFDNEIICKHFYNMFYEFNEIEKDDK